jgi:hypothetical protein
LLDSEGTDDGTQEGWLDLDGAVNGTDKARLIREAKSMAQTKAGFTRYLKGSADGTDEGWLDSEGTGGGTADKGQLDLDGTVEGTDEGWLDLNGAVDGTDESSLA